MKPDDTVCYCYHVPLRKIVNYIERENPPVASLISQCLSAGTGCGWCVPFLRKLHRDMQAGRPGGLTRLTADEYEKMRSGWLDEKKPGRDLDRFADDVLSGDAEDEGCDE
ncbi:MAG: hypothetical protein BIFFINMI_02529 [Phycisphaerae bacterium]|nr:hypothetical protein [Phycisphaerae bacterium]